MLNLTRPTIIAAGLGGALWTVKVLGIIATDGSFGTLEDVTFLGGLAALFAACLLVAVDVSRRLRGLARAAATVAAAIGLLAATVALEALGVSVVGGLYDGGNVGIEDEAGILLAGLAWLALALTATRSGASPRTRTAVPAVR